MDNLEKEIEQLLEDRIIKVIVEKKKNLFYNFTSLLPVRQSTLSVGSTCRGVVVQKDDNRRQLVLHLTYLVQRTRTISLNHLRLRAVIRDFDLKQEFTIFTYVGNYKQIKTGTEIVSQVRNVRELEGKICYEMTLKTINEKVCPLGVGKEVEIEEKEWKIFQQSGYFPAFFLTKYERQFQNPGLIKNLCEDLGVNEQQPGWSGSNIPALKMLGLDFERLFFDMKQSSIGSRQIVGKLLKEGKNEYALQHLNLARGFDKKNCRILIARGCAQANLNNLNEGLKDIKQALYLDPHSKEAIQYYEQIKEKLSNRDSIRDEERVKKIKNNEYEVVHRKH